MRQRVRRRDLPGNVDEVVQSEHFNEPGFKGKFDSIHTGSPWYQGVPNQCRPKIYTYDEGFYYYSWGFAAALSLTARPRAARQAGQDGWKWSRVEKSAGFTR